MSSTCRSCGAAIVWCVTENGKRIPVNDVIDPVKGNLRLVAQSGGRPMIARVVESGAGTHTSHFYTCPNAGQHRHKK